MGCKQACGGNKSIFDAATNTGAGGGGGQEEEETRVDGKASIIESVPSSVEPDPDNTIILSASQLARTRAIEWRVLYFRFSAQAGIRRKKRWEVKKIKK